MGRFEFVLVFFPRRERDITLPECFPVHEWTIWVGTVRLDAFGKGVEKGYLRGVETGRYGSRNPWLLSFSLSLWVFALFPFSAFFLRFLPFFSHCIPFWAFVVERVLFFHSFY